MPSETPLGRLGEILDNIVGIERLTPGVDFATCEANEQARYASLHALLIVSEAAGKLGDEANTLVPGQPCANIRSIGNVLRHKYDGVDPEIVAGHSRRRPGFVEARCRRGSGALSRRAVAVLIGYARVSSGQAYPQRGTKAGSGAVLRQGDGLGKDGGGGRECPPTATG